MADWCWRHEKGGPPEPCPACDEEAAEQAQYRQEQAERLETASRWVSGSRLPTDAITVWAFHEAPRELAALSEHGGDEDWLFLVPPGYSDRHHIYWLDWANTFGNVSSTDLPNGWIVKILAHG